VNAEDYHQYRQLQKSTSRKNNLFSSFFIFLVSFFKDFPIFVFLLAIIFSEGEGFIANSKLKFSDNL